MTLIRPKDTDALLTLASNHEILVDGPDGFGTFLRDTFISQVAALIVANPTTYKIATLDGADKLTSSQDPSQAVSYKGTHNVSTNSPSLADGTGTAGDTYQVNVAGTRNYGSGSLTLAVGDALVYSGSVWQQVPGVANILNGISTASAARSAIEVNSADEDAQAIATKQVGPALYFTTNDYIEFADDGKWSFTNSADDQPFSISAWINLQDATSFPIIAKYGGSAAIREYRFQLAGDDKLQLWMIDTSGNNIKAETSVALTGYEGQWIHVGASYGGAGPNSASAFTAAASEITIYVNGVADTVRTENESYGGMSNTAQAVWVGQQSGVFAKGYIAKLQVFNRELSATEFAKLARGVDLGFADEFGGATATSGTLVVGKRYRLRDWITGDDFTNVGAGSNADGVEFVATGTTPTTWTNSSVVENIGILADLRSEDFNSSAGKLIDRSSNNFVGVNNGATLVGARRHIAASTLNLTGLPTSASGLSAGEVWSNSGVLTIVT